MVIALGAGALAAPFGAFGQPAGRVPRVGILSAATQAVNAERIDAFKLGLRELGYVEGKSILIDYRWADGRLDRLPGLAAELLQLKVDVIFAAGPADTRAAKYATSTIPIVMGFDPDPVANGFIATLARPGGNITGLSTLAPELSSKQLELMKEIVPKLSRVAVIGSSIEPGNAQVLKELELAARAFKVQLQNLDILDPKDIETAFRAITKGRADAVLVLQSPVASTHSVQLIEHAAKSRLPAIYPRSEFVKAGGFMSYGVNRIELGRRAAVYVDKILKGARPGDLPVEQPTKFEVLINGKTAKALGIKIPNSILVQATKVIE
jgi:putative ABC transport system substrate-binding protein